MCSKQSVNSAGRSHQIHVRIEDGGAEGAGKHPGQVHCPYPGRPVHHLQWEAHQ